MMITVRPSALASPANIDPATEALLQRAVEASAEGRTVIIIAHRLATLRGCDRLYVFRDGRVAEHGTDAELRASGVFTSRFDWLPANRVRATFFATHCSPCKSCCTRLCTDLSVWRSAAQAPGSISPCTSPALFLAVRSCSWCTDRWRNHAA